MHVILSILNKIPRASKGFPGSSVGKESTCNAGDPSSIPGSGRSPGERIGYPLQYSWASLVAQLVKNLPAMWETWVGKISWRRERLPTPVFWPGEFHGLYSPRGRKESDATEWLSLSNKIPNFQVFGVESVVLKKYVKFARALTKLDWEGEAF